MGAAQCAQSKQAVESRKAPMHESRARWAGAAGSRIPR